MEKKTFDYKAHGWNYKERIVGHRSRRVFDFFIRIGRGRVGSTLWDKPVCISCHREVTRASSRPRLSSRLSSLFLSLLLLFILLNRPICFRLLESLNFKYFTAVYFLNIIVSGISKIGTKDEKSFLSKFYRANFFIAASRGTGSFWPEPTFPCDFFLLPSQLDNVFEIV